MFLLSWFIRAMPKTCSIPICSPSLHSLGVLSKCAVLPRTPGKIVLSTPTRVNLCLCCLGNNVKLPPLETSGGLPALHLRCWGVKFPIISLLIKVFNHFSVQSCLPGCVALVVRSINVLRRAGFSVGDIEVKSEWEHRKSRRKTFGLQQVFSSGIGKRHK